MFVPANDHPAAASPEQLIAECDVRRLRRSGPGGQHRNKVETAISLHHLPTGVRAEASERRSQAQNHSVALFRLRVNLALEVRRACGADYVPSPLWQSRCGGGAMKLSAAHDDFPALLAEALDVFAALDFEPKPPTVLRCTPSQLIRLLNNAGALAFVNHARRVHGRCTRCGKKVSQYAPLQPSTFRGVRQRSSISVLRLWFRTYQRSIRDHSSKPMSLRPLTCQRHVSPGFTARRRSCQGSKRATSRMSSGRGPTSDICPKSTWNNCGVSSRLVFRRMRPSGVIRGSRRFLKVGPRSRWRPCA